MRFWRIHTAQASPFASCNRRRFFFRTSVCLRAFSSSQIAHVGKDTLSASVRNFDQLATNSRKREAVDVETKNHSEEEDVISRIRDLRRELDLLKEGPFGPNSPLVIQLPDAEKNALRETLKEYDSKVAQLPGYDNDIVEHELENFYTESKAVFERAQEKAWESEGHRAIPCETFRQPAFAVELKVSDMHSSYVEQFNKSLAALERSSNQLSREEVWRWYRRCAESISSFISMVPDVALKMLWDSQARIHGADDYDLKRGQNLARDIISNGKSLTQSQWLDYVDILYRSDKIDQGISQWRSRGREFDFTSPSEQRRYWFLGIQLLVANGNLEEAERVAMSLLSESSTAEDYRILIPIICSWAKVPGTRSGCHVWALYLKFKASMKASITMNDYDTISVGLIEANRTDLAIAVFKDMMLTGQNSSYDSTEIYRMSVGLMRRMDQPYITDFDASKISLSALTMLPRRFQNKFFYASWMKKLIGMGKVDAAASVAELMYERGINPDPKHLNGIIGGWLRGRNLTSRTKALELAWAMIQKRMSKVHTRCSIRPLLCEQNIPLQDSEQNSFIPMHLKRLVPPANTETFSILLLYYSRKQNVDFVNYLIECLERASLRPNAFFMNHLLYFELRKHDISAVWSRYQDMSRNTLPDLQTFACLWDCAKLHTDPSRNTLDSEFPSNRIIYREMMRWYLNLSTGQQFIARSEFSKELYDQIIRCFSFSLDVPGTLVALSSLNDSFHMAPDEDTIQIIMFQAMRLASGDPESTKLRRHRVRSIIRSKQNTEYLNQLFWLVRDRRIAKLAKESIIDSDMGNEIQKRVQMASVGDLFREILDQKTIYGSAALTEQNIQMAASEMGVHDKSVGWTACT